MRLILSGRHPRETTYTDSETSQVLYKVGKPPGLGRETVTIQKAVRTIGGVWRGDSEQTGEQSPRGIESKSAARSVARRNTWAGNAREHEDSSPEQGVDLPDSVNEELESNTTADPRVEADEPALEGHFAFYAQIEFKTVLPSRIKYNNQDVSVRDYFRKEGLSWYGRGRVFKASDGKEYRWEFRIDCLAMVSNENPKLVLARYRHYMPSLGPLFKQRPAHLEVDDSCKAILDEIILTFVYCQKIRRDRERPAVKTMTRKLSVS